jgi:hypothetical protein
MGEAGYSEGCWTFTVEAGPTYAGSLIRGLQWMILSHPATPVDEVCSLMIESVEAAVAAALSTEHKP